MSRYSFAPRRVEKPWGWELIWAEADQYVGKLLFIRAGEALSLQYHEMKHESWLVHEGRARLELGQADDGALEIVEVRRRPRRGPLRARRHVRSLNPL